MCKNNIKLIYLTFIHSTYKFEKHKQSFLSENYEQTFPIKKHKQSNTHEKHKQSFPSENYNRIFHNKKRVLRRPIVFLRIRRSVCVRCSILTFIDKNCSL